MITDYSGPNLMGQPFFSFNTTWPPAFYVAASLTVPTYSQGSSPSWNFTEPTDPNYARQNSPNFTTGTWPSAYQILSNSGVSFPSASTSWSSAALYLGIFDAMTGGNLWFYLPVCRVVTDAALTSGSTNLTSSTADFVSGDVGQVVQVPGLPVGTTIVSRTSSTEVVVSAEASATGSDLTLAISTPATVSSGDSLTIASGSLALVFQ